MGVNEWNVETETDLLTFFWCDEKAVKVQMLMQFLKAVRTSITTSQADSHKA